MIPALAFLFIFVPMLLEARVSRAHEHALRRSGAYEPPDDVYPLMQVAYPALFLVMIGEGLARRVALDGLVVCGALVYVAAKALKYWAVSTLGIRWTFRVLVPPHSSRIVRGPYQWLRHPNYVAVAGEIAGIALAMHAWVSGGPALVFFVALMWRRIAVEERALAAAEGYNSRR